MQAGVKVTSRTLAEWRGLFCRKPTIRAGLSFLAFACIIPAVAAQIVLAYHSYGEQRLQLLAQTVLRARALVEVLDQDMATAQGAIRALGTSPSLAAHDYESFYRQAQEVQRQQGADNVVLSDPSGQQIINTLRPYGEELPMGKFPNSGAVSTTDSAKITSLFMGAVSNKPHFSIQIPIRRDGQIANTLTIGMFPERIDALLPYTETIPGQIVGVIDGNGRIVARSKKPTALVGQKVPAEIFERLAAKEGYFPTRTADGAPAMFLFSRSLKSGWVAYLTIPDSYFEASLWNSMKWPVVFPVLSASATLLIVWLIGGAIAKSITGLITPAIALAYGKEVSVGRLYFREAEEVGQALIDASEVLFNTKHQAQHDHLTNLANRAFFDDMLRQQTLFCEKTGGRFSVLNLDLDGFKAVNDSFGHLVGDKLLCAVSQRLIDGVTTEAIVSRTGGDEFAVLIPDIGCMAAQVVARRLVDEISAPYCLGGQNLFISASIGIAAYPETANTPSNLIRAADSAMYKAKRAGKRQCILAEPLKAA